MLNYNCDSRGGHATALQETLEWRAHVQVDCLNMMQSHCKGSRERGTLKKRIPQNVLTIGFACTMSDAAYPAHQDMRRCQGAVVNSCTHSMHPCILQKDCCRG